VGEHLLNGLHRSPRTTRPHCYVVSHPHTADCKMVQRWNASRMDAAVAAAPTVVGRPSSSSVVRSSE
jgi:hypothetical protein